MGSPVWSPDDQTLSPSEHEGQESDKVQHNGSDHEGQAAVARRSRKGKRNKPTLNCRECVDRKTVLSTLSILLMTTHS